MFLHRIHLDPRCREARRDLSDPYQLHSTLCRVFSAPDNRCPEGEFLWRLEPETDPAGSPRILVQSKAMPNWAGVGVQGWLANADSAIDLKERLKLESLKVGQRFRFRLRANPCVTYDGKRLGLLQTDEQEAWLERKGKQHGFSLPQLAPFDFSEAPQKRIDVRISQEQMLRGKQHTGNGIRIYSVLYDGILIVTESDNFRTALENGIGHGKVMGLGLLSVIPIA
ncbi:MAG: type I-E CRISPR-associated protein Cas6/Cse3/CasE [Nitrosomonas sp.]|uniref:type I-E CRISPR-associated protein Cas6/Cse3/CasE n=1 Tax=Nitrosomonas sp. TaxID=42353 RepID=UPI0025F59D59|nr:type I-E CRISPR-associated protein Cas6/Cse3/CasE [Nitrosomonas sp.]UJP04042.1 MAG: type I-E CRISPR-associated protein Cas6/Cse3/CasE [Nitrosomonas sp.]